MRTLAAPGAGLPKPELLIARIRFRLIRQRTNAETATQDFVRTHQQIMELCQSMDETEAAKQVVIKRLRGMEDSSRDWSIYMTAEHLRIVNDAILETVELLLQGKVPPRTVSTADVKPDVGVSRSVLEGFDKSCHHYSESLASISDLKTPVSYPHPWFGPLDAYGWHVLAAFHMQLHYKQMQRIRVTLEDAS